MLDNKRILLTGANGGIGNSIARTLLKNNGRLVLLYNKNREKIDELLQEFQKEDCSIEVFQIDLLKDESIEETFSIILDNSQIDAFIHCVTSNVEHKNILKCTWNDYQNHINLQSKSFLNIVQKITPIMIQQKSGKIITVLTSYTVGPPPNQISPYLVGKYSLLGLTKSLAVELGHYGITVNSVSPSMTNTKLISNIPEKLKEITAKQTPLQRLAEPKDISSVILFLCSKYSNYISGENLLITGGSNMH